MKILSLFDGMACGMLALLECGIEVERYVAYETDPHAVKTSSHNFPQIEHRGDVFEGDFTQFRGFDALIGGSPCTHWSIAQTRSRETEASGIGWELFNQYVRAFHEAKPRFFIYENNKSMSQAIRQSISEAFGFGPVCINSALVSAQNRQRLYWVGVRQADGTYAPVPVEQPEDRGIMLRDVLDGAFGVGDTGGKSYAQTASYGKNPPLENTLTRHQRTMVAEPVAVDLQSGADGKTYPVYRVEGGYITIKGQRYPIKLSDGWWIIRKLTVGECKRLQTVPEWYEFPVSNTQAYRMLGNGWTVEVIAHLIRAVMEDTKEKIR